MAIPSFAQTGGLFLSATTTSANAVIPTTGTPTIAIVTNLGAVPAFVALGNDSVAAVAGVSEAILPGAEVILTIGANTNIAVVTLASTTGLNVAVGN